MEWQKQVEEMTQNWTETQKKMWQDWTEAMKGFGTAPANEMWTKSVEAWQEMVQNNVKSQEEWTKMWAEGVTKMDGVPEPFVEWAKQTEKMNIQWNENQLKLWNQWFEMIKKVEPVSMPNVWNTDGQKMFEAWQETVNQAMKTQAEWMQSWTTTTAGKKK